MNKIADPLSLIFLSNMCVYFKVPNLSEALSLREEEAEYQNHKPYN